MEHLGSFPPPDPGSAQIVNTRYLSGEIHSSAPAGGVIVCDPDHRVVFATGSEFGRFDIEVDGLAGKLFHDVAPVNFWDSLRPSFEAAARGRSTTLELNLAGEIFTFRVSPIVSDGEITGILTVSPDSDEQRRRLVNAGDRALLELGAEALYSTAFDRAPFGISVTDLDLAWLRVNDAYCSMLGYEREEILSMAPADLTHPADHHLDLEWRRLAASGLSDSLELEKRFIAKDGSVVWARVRDEMIRGDDGRPAFTLSLTEDITESRSRESLGRDRVMWTERIEDAIAADRLTLHAQPILDLASGETDRDELLVRMFSEFDRSKLIPPGEFLPAAERFDLIPAIDRWVVERAMGIARHQQVEINLSGKTISDPAQVREIERIVGESGAPPGNITFEITETAVAGDMDSARYFADCLRSLGCNFALDDFGVGFGTFTYLKHLPVDYLKIDIEFVRDLLNDESDRQVVRAIVGAASLFQMETIAEGVEDQQTLELLAEMNVDYAQGYWIGRPAPYEDRYPSTGIPKDAYERQRD